MDELEQLVELRKQHLENNEKVLKEYDKQIELLTHQKRKNWLKTITDEQKNLLDRIYDLNESLFCDLTRDELLEEERIDQFGGSDYTDDLFSKTMVFIDPTLSCEGECDFKDNTLRFHPDHLQDKVIVHEMLHLYDEFLNRKIMEKEFWITRLYSRLHAKFDDLDAYCRILVFDSGGLHALGGEHSIFFLLKSLDLDVRLNLPFGSVFGYNKALGLGANLAQNGLY